MQMQKTICKLFLFWLVSIFNFCYATYSQNIPATYAFEFTPQQWLTMRDGVRLSINYWKPKAKKSDEKFPIVLEVLPYRKDDVHFIGDYYIGRYYARRGIVFARVDIRGTGSSNGTVPDREYSDQELNDIREILKQLVKKPWSNGNIGMQGISWSAFNSLMTAMQKPKELKAILVAHGSDDLYANDIHNIDGALDLDIFTIQIETDNLLPQSPQYRLDNAYFKNRFDVSPWIFTFLKHQRDGEFWQKNRSLRTNYSAITIPVYAFSALLDGYRDFAINTLKNSKAPIRVAVGPQNHAWPDGDPGPRYEWRQMAINFWYQTLKGENRYFWQHPNLTVFMRDPVKPSIHLQETAGSYLMLNWPVKERYTLELIPEVNGGLATSRGKMGVNELHYHPSVGNGVLNWWGEVTPDMRDADIFSFIYTTPPLTKDFYLLGNPEVSLNVAQTELEKQSNNAIFAHWIVRLEDVHPDGSVSLITGGLQNSAQRLSREKPQSVQPGKYYILKFPLHFTTWKFTQGHKIRLVISNAFFPMIWPTPEKMQTKIQVGDGATKIILPLIPMKKYPKPNLPPIETEEPIPEAKYLQQHALTPFTISRDKNANVTAKANESYTLAIQGNKISEKYKVFYRVNEKNPADAEFIGEGEDSITIAKTGRIIIVWAKIIIRSDAKIFFTRVERKIFENGKLMKERVFKENIPRDFQ